MNDVALSDVELRMLVEARLTDASRLSANGADTTVLDFHLRRIAELLAVLKAREDAREEAETARRAARRAVSLAGRTTNPCGFYPPLA